MDSHTDMISKELVAEVCSNLAMGNLDGDEKYKARLAIIARRVIEYGGQCVKEAQGSSKDKTADELKVAKEELKAAKEELKAAKEELKAIKNRLNAMESLITTAGL
jgi:predicted translin family RNA/ssDNA-binding protein